MRDTYSRVVSTTALVLALGTGTAYAAELIGPEDIAANAVRSGHLLDGTVSTGDLADSGVRSADVLNNGLSGVDLADGSVRGVDIANGAVAGADIADGAVSGADIANWTVGAADLVPGLIPRGPQADMGEGEPPYPNPGGCCAGGPTVSLTKWTRLMVLLNTQDAEVQCYEGATCQIKVGAYARNTATSKIWEIPGTAFTLTAAPPGGNARASRTTFGMVTLPPGTYAIGRGFTQHGDIYYAIGGTPHALAMTLSD